jgi:hypothetical protein
MSWKDEPTEEQRKAIARICMRKGIRAPLEETPRTRLEARNLLYRVSHTKGGGVYK